MGNPNQIVDAATSRYDTDMKFHEQVIETVQVIQWGKGTAYSKEETEAMALGVCVALNMMEIALEQAIVGGSDE
jgi:hypothetical protein